MFSGLLGGFQGQIIKPHPPSGPGPRAQVLGIEAVKIKGMFEIVLLWCHFSFYREYNHPQNEGKHPQNE